MSETQPVTVIDGLFKVTVRPRRFESPRQYYAKTRIYVSDECVENTSDKYNELKLQEENLPDGDRFIARDVKPEIDKLYDRMNRAFATAARKVAQEAMKIVGDERHLGLNTHFAKCHFSRTAGCTCPCSPGVVADVRITMDSRSVDMWVEMA